MTTPTTPPDPYKYGGRPPAGDAFPPPSAPVPPDPTWQQPPAPPGSWPQQPPAAPQGAWPQPPVGPGAPPPAWGGVPAGRRTSFDPKAVNPLDWGILGAGVLAFLLSFVVFYSARTSVSFGGIKQSSSSSASAWHEIFGGGFFGWIAMVLALAGAVVLALTLFMPQMKLPFPIAARLLVLGLFALAASCELLAIFIHPDFASGSTAGFSYSVGHGFGFWLSLIVILAGAVLSFMRLQQTGGTLPWEKKGV